MEIRFHMVYLFLRLYIHDTTKQAWFGISPALHLPASVSFPVPHIDNKVVVQRCTVLLDFPSEGIPFPNIGWIFADILFLGKRCGYCPNYTLLPYVVGAYRSGIAFDSIFQRVTKRVIPAISRYCLFFWLRFMEKPFPITYLWYDYTITWGNSQQTHSGVMEQRSVVVDFDAKITKFFPILLHSPIECVTITIYQNT